MSYQDTRTLPENCWTYYVVGHLPTMEPFYRVDTIHEAIQLYQLYPNQRSAIGASINGTDELDLIHRREGNTPVLVMDFASERSSPHWQDPEIQKTIDQLIALLGIHHQYNSQIFVGFPSVIVELERFKDDALDSYFADKRLLPAPTPSGNPPANKYLSAIQEVYVRGHGWLDRNAFLTLLSNSRPAAPGMPAKDLFVDWLNVAYRKEKSYDGQADISPHEFRLLKEKTERERAAGEWSTSKPPLEPRLQSAKNTASESRVSKNIPHSPFSR